MTDFIYNLVNGVDRFSSKRDEGKTEAIAVLEMFVEDKRGKLSIDDVAYISKNFSNLLNAAKEDIKNNIEENKYLEEKIKEIKEAQEKLNEYL